MTEKEILALREEFSQNELYKKSCSPYKDCQFEQFSADGEILEGRHGKTDVINGKERYVIFTFKNGLIHSQDGMAAVEFPNHWEWWNNGLLEKVIDNDAGVEEIWKDGVPISISERTDTEK